MIKKYYVRLSFFGKRHDFIAKAKNDKGAIKMAIEKGKKNIGKEFLIQMIKTS